MPISSGCPQIADSSAWDAASLTTKDHLQRPALLLVGSCIDEESHFKPGGFACPEIALEGANSYEVQASERHIAVVPFTDVVR